MICQPHYDGRIVNKDIISKGNKLFSPETCMVVPTELGRLFIKEKYASGVTIGKSKVRKYTAMLTSYGVRQHLGTFRTEDEARSVYLQARGEYIHDIADGLSTDEDPRLKPALRRRGDEHIAKAKEVRENMNVAVDQIVPSLEHKRDDLVGGV